MSPAAIAGPLAAIAGRASPACGVGITESAPHGGSIIVQDFNMTIFIRSKAIAALPSVALLLTLALPGDAIACACGCGLFEVGTGGQLPTTTQSGTTLFAQFAYLDQNQNWSGSSSAPAAANSDK
ncbi:MAG: hypothetical protein KGJ32_14920, partial [Xanthomonadaceae bacterium]|nr:hypothetical protein [Xanthomonadaceae bacterium]